MLIQILVTTFRLLIQVLAIAVTFFGLRGTNTIRDRLLRSMMKLIKSLYDDGDVETLKMSQETWSFLVSSSDASLIAASCAFELQSSLQNDLQSMLDHFGNKVFSDIRFKAFRIIYSRKHGLLKMKASSALCVLFLDPLLPTVVLSSLPMCFTR